MDGNCYIFRLCDDIELMIGSRPGYFWLLCWRFIGPLAMVVIFVASLIEIFSKGVSYEVWNSLKVCDRQFIFGTVHLVIRNQMHQAINQFFLKIQHCACDILLCLFLFLIDISETNSVILCGNRQSVHIQQTCLFCLLYTG